MSKRIITRKPTGAELRAQRDQRLGQPYEMQEAGRRERSFLKNITGAQDDLEWILTNRAWSQLGFERVADWWQARVVPAAGGFVDLRPSSAMVGRVIQAIVADEAELPKVQRRTQREIASIVRTSPATVSRSLHVPDETGSDLDKDSGDVSTSPADVPGQAAAVGRIEEPAADGDAGHGAGVPGKPQDPSGDAHEGEPSPEVRNSPDAGDASIGLEPVPHPGPDTPAAAFPDPAALVAEQLGPVYVTTADDDVVATWPDSPLARGEAPSDDGVVQPSAVAVAARAGDEVEGGRLPPSTVQDLTEGQTSLGSVRPSAGAGVSPAVGVEEEPLAPAGSSSTDPASDWMATWRSFVGALESLDVDAVRPMLTDAEIAEMDADYPYIGKRLTTLGVWSTT